MENQLVATYTSSVVWQSAGVLLVIRLLIAKDYRLMGKQAVYKGNSLATSQSFHLGVFPI